MTPTSPSNKQRVITMLLAAVLALSMTTMLIQKTAAQTTYYVTISGFAFNPQNLTIQRGATVVWNNTDPVIYTLWFVNPTDGSTYLLSDPILPGENWSHTFTDVEGLQLQYYSFERLWISGLLRVTYVGDFDGDFDVDYDDIVYFVTAYINYWSGGGKDPKCDFDNDCDIDYDDILIFVTAYIDYWTP